MTRCPICKKAYTYIDNIPYEPCGCAASLFRTDPSWAIAPIVFIVPQPERVKVPDAFYKAFEEQE